MAAANEVGFLCAFELYAIRFDGRLLVRNSIIYRGDMMNKLVTVALPVYKRFEFLPDTLGIIEAQSYENLSLLVSDNGENGESLRELVDRHYSRPYRFRRNTQSVDITTHFNQLIDAAEGEYFVLLCDDDEISANFVEVLVDLLERHPEVNIAFSHQEKIDRSGERLRSSITGRPELIPGDEFMDLRIDYKRTGIRNTVTHLARTRALRKCGGWPDFVKNHFSDEALVLKLSIGSSVAYSEDCVFRHRAYNESFGLSLSAWEHARSIREFVDFLHSDPRLVRFAKQNPRRFENLRDRIVRMIWRQYFRAWRGRYRNEVTHFEWIRSAFAMPFIPRYYARIVWPLLRYSASKVKSSIGSWA